MFLFIFGIFKGGGVLLIGCGLVKIKVFEGCCCVLSLMVFWFVVFLIIFVFLINDDYGIDKIIIKLFSI